MKRLTLLVALATTAATPMVGTTAWAGTPGPYIEAEGGVTVSQNQDVDAPVGTLAGIHNHVGWNAGGSLGYDFGHFRIEAEGIYQRLRSERVYTAAGTTYNGANFSAQANTLAGMGNALVELGPIHGPQFFAGGGAGYARTRERFFLPNGLGGLHDQENGFAWQALAGVTAPINSHWDVGIKYRYFNPTAHHYRLDDGTPANVRLRTHSVMGTLSYHFGSAPAPMPEEAAPPPPPPPLAPPPPPPPPPPMAQVCNKGPYIVFFEFDKSDVTPEASSILDNAVQAYSNCSSVPIMLAGYTDLAGSQRYNLALSDRRNASVRSYLNAHGIPDGVISSRGYGKTNPRVPTADGVRELQNRRVEITYGPGAGN